MKKQTAMNPACKNFGKANPAIGELCFKSFVVAIYDTNGRSCYA